jgi:hypothetical protein
MADQLHHPDNIERSVPKSGQAGRKQTPVEQAQNGSMVQDEQDMKRLGNDMKQMKTNSEIKQDGLVPDPIQE